jgi:hypothetical protein
MALPLCPNCWSERLRTSGFRLLDALWLIVLRIPMRCRDCEERFHFSMLSIGRGPFKRGAPSN